MGTSAFVPFRNRNFSRPRAMNVTKLHRYHDFNQEHATSVFKKQKHHKTGSWCKDPGPGPDFPQFEDHR